MDVLLPLTLPTLIYTVGSLGIFLVVFADAGLLLGLVLPGDSLLCTAGLLASQGPRNLWSRMLVASLGAMRGDSVGYACGQRMGPKLLTRATAWFVTTHQLAHVRQFDARHGGETIVLARFVPVIRTLAPMLAGVAERPYGTCLASNIVGGLCWAISLSALDYGLGHTVPDMDQYLLPILGLMGLLALSPTLVRALQSGLQKRPRHG